MAPLAVPPLASSTHLPLPWLTTEYQVVVEIPPVGVGVGPLGVLVGGTKVGVSVGPLPCERFIQLKFMPPLSTTQRNVCAPVLRVTPVLVIVCQVCQPPVLGTVIVPVTFVPSTSRWKVEVVFVEATRKSRL